MPASNSLALENPVLEVVEDRASPALGSIENHCPFGCVINSEDPAFDLDKETGYCRHLLGFTNDEKVYEPVTDWLMRTKDENGKIVYIPNGLKAVRGGKEVLRIDRKTMEIVNPIKPQTVDGVTYQTKRWVSGRVYTSHGDPRRDNTKQTATERNLLQQLQELQKKVEELELAKGGTKARV